MVNAFLAAGRESSVGLLWRVAFALEFVVFLTEILLFMVKITVSQDIVQLAIEHMPMVTAVYLFIQVMAVVTASGSFDFKHFFGDVAFSLILVLGFVLPVAIGYVDFEGTWPWEWTYRFHEIPEFTSVFIRHFGPILLSELIIVASLYWKLAKLESEFTSRQ